MNCSYMIFDFFDSPELLDIQRTGFYRFLNQGIPQLLSKEFPIKVKNGSYSLELCLNEKNVKLIAPEDDPRDCILKMKSYNCKLYAQVKIVCKRSSSLGNKEKIVYQGLPEWVLLGQVPMMTKRGHFIINGSPRVVVHQVVRSPGIYFQKLIKKDDQNKARFYGDIIPLKGVWVRLQMSRKGRVEAKFKKGKKVEVELLQKCLQVIENQTVRGRKNVTKNQAGSLLYDEYSKLLDKKKSRAESKAEHDAFVHTYDKLYRTTQDKELEEWQKKKKNQDFFKGSFSFSTQLFSRRPKLSQLPYPFLSNTGKGDAHVLWARARARATNKAVLSNQPFTNGCRKACTASLEAGFAWQKVENLKNGKGNPTANQDTVWSQKPGFDFYPSLVVPMAMPSLTVYKSRIWNRTSPFVPVPVPVPKGHGHGHGHGHRLQVQITALTNRRFVRDLQGELQQDLLGQGVPVPVPVPKGHGHGHGHGQETAFKRKKCSENLFSTFKIESRYDLGLLGREKINNKFGFSFNNTQKPSFHSFVKGSQIQTTALTNLFPSAIVPRRFALVTDLQEDLLGIDQTSVLSESGNTQLTALDLCSATLWLYKLRKGEQSTDDIDHSQNRRVKTSGELLQTQFENGVYRLKNLLSTKLQEWRGDLSSSFFSSIFKLSCKTRCNSNNSKKSLFKEISYFEQKSFINVLSAPMANKSKICNPMPNKSSCKSLICTCNPLQSRALYDSFKKSCPANFYKKRVCTPPQRFGVAWGDGFVTRFLEAGPAKVSAKASVPRKFATRFVRASCSKESFELQRRPFFNPKERTTLLAKWSFTAQNRGLTGKSYCRRKLTLLHRMQGNAILSGRAPIPSSPSPTVKGKEVTPVPVRGIKSSIYNPVQSQRWENQNRALTIRSKQNHEISYKLSAKELFSTKPITGALREFFGSNPLSQYMDQTNPLAEITHKRRISSLGVGGVSRESAGMAIRGIHPTHYGRICPIETPEGKNAGLVNSLAFYTKVDKDGFLKTPYYRVFKGQIQPSLGFSFCSAREESLTGLQIAPSDLQKSSNNVLKTSTLESVPVRVADNLLDVFKKENPYKVQLIAISPIQMISVATSLIPFLEHNDANRALMGSNMQRQAVPLMISERPVVGTGLESTVIVESGHITESQTSGFASHVDADKVIIDSLSYRKKERCSDRQKCIQNNALHINPTLILQGCVKRVRIGCNKLCLPILKEEHGYPCGGEARAGQRGKHGLQIFDLLPLGAMPEQAQRPVPVRFAKPLLHNRKPTSNLKVALLKQSFISCYYKSKGLCYGCFNGLKKINHLTNLAGKGCAPISLQLYQEDLLLHSTKGVPSVTAGRCLARRQRAAKLRRPVLLCKSSPTKSIPCKIVFAYKKRLCLQKLGMQALGFPRKVRAMPNKSSCKICTCSCNPVPMPNKSSCKSLICTCKPVPVPVGESNRRLVRHGVTNLLDTIVRHEQRSATADLARRFGGLQVQILQKHEQESALESWKESCTQKQCLLVSTVSKLTTFSRSNQNTCITEKPLVREFDWIQKGDILSDCSASNNGELAVGKNVLLAYIPWEGYNFEDAIVISERLVREHVYTSLHIERYIFQAQDLKDGNEWFTRHLPGVQPHSIQHLEESGLPKIGSFLQEGDIIVGKIRYLNKKPSSPYERLLCDILGEKNFSARNKSLYVPKGVEARVIYHKVISLFDNDPENKIRPMGAAKTVHLFLGEKRVIQVGDKISGRHGNKGVISTILPRQDMPYLPDGTPIDIILNPLGVPSRMNVGQVLECLLGLAASYLNQNFKIAAFDERYGVEASKSIVFLKLYQARLLSGQNWLFQVAFPGKTRLVDGRSGECFDQWITVGRAYILKLIHMVSEKIHARSTGPYALITQQPLRGRSNKGGQRLGEMEVWALEGFGAAYTLQELLTKKSDDFFGRKQIVDSILPSPVSVVDTLKPSRRIDQNRNILGHPEIFKVLLCELQALCLDLGVYILTPDSFQRSFLGVVH